MTRPLVAALLVSGALVASAAPVLAHHSFAMFDRANPVELEGTVREFKYVAPHSFILLEVKDTDGSSTVWNLEGGAPSLLAREGWTRASLKPGDQIRLMVDPLRSGAPGGAWNAGKVKFKDGRPIIGE